MRVARRRQKSNSPARRRRLVRERRRHLHPERAVDELARARQQTAIVDGARVFGERERREPGIAELAPGRGSPARPDDWRARAPPIGDRLPLPSNAPSAPFGGARGRRGAQSYAGLVAQRVDIDRVGDEPLRVVSTKTPGGDARAPGSGSRPSGRWWRAQIQIADSVPWKSTSSEPGQAGTLPFRPAAVSCRSASTWPAAAR
jgi:hypothetical protein